MKIVLAPDSFKGSLSAPDAANCIAIGLRRVFPDVQIVALPVADGGEGTLETLIAATNGQFLVENVTGPLGEPVSARWGILGGPNAGETTAVIELAQAAGLTMVPNDRRDPKITTTIGVGELLAAALREKNVRKLVIGLGGSATNDGGAGLLQAFGVQLLDENGANLPAGGASLQNLARVEGLSGATARFAGITVQIACDVDNPLWGPRGASAVFGPQKGATPQDIALLDRALAQFARILAQNVPNFPQNGPDIAQTPGSGAAGGAAAGLLYLIPHANLRPGIEIVLDAVQFDMHSADADLIITGEGRLDAQTLGGKVVAGVAMRAKSVRAGKNVPVVALVGGLTGEVDGKLLADTLNLSAVMPILPHPCLLSEAIAQARPFLTDAAERAARWLAVGARISTP